MSYELTHDESLSEGVERMARRQLKKAVQALDSGGGDIKDDAVHSARKQLKKLRALLRLVKGQMRNKDFSRENRSYRDAGRSISGMRDAEVWVKTIDLLKEHLPSGKESQAAHSRIRELLVKKCEEVHSQAFTPEALKKTSAVLETSLKNVSKWVPEDLEWIDLCVKIKRSYRCGRRLFRECQDQPGSKALHEWRKKVKDLWYHIRLIKLAWPEVMGRLAREVKTLSEYLGDEHDLHVLGETLLQISPAKAAREDLERLIPVIEARRKELQNSAFKLGEKLYVEKPSAFARRIEGYWHTWRKQGDATDPASDPAAI